MAIANRVYRACYADGRAKRLDRELARQGGDTSPLKVPLYSHHATRQSFFNKGWHSVTEIDIRIKEDIQLAVTPSERLKQIFQELNQ